MPRRCLWAPCGAEFHPGSGRGAHKRVCCSPEHAQLWAEELNRRRALRWYYGHKTEVLARQASRRALDRAMMALKKQSGL